MRILVDPARDGREVSMLTPASTLLTAMISGAIDEDPSHGLSGGGEEVAAALELLIADQSEVGLVDQGSGLQGVIRSLLRHACGREFPQLVVNKRQEFGGSLAVTGRGGFE
jgi:hypothetical protein